MKLAQKEIAHEIEAMLENRSGQKKDIFLTKTDKVSMIIG
jgi:uncharacterized protein (DUF1697 family)